MKSICTKAGYMLIGSLLTLIGYHFGNVENNSVNAQDSFQTTGEIVNTLRVRQIEILGTDNRPRIYFGTDLDRGQIKFVDDRDTSQLKFKATSQGGLIALYNRSGTPKIALNFDTEDRGRIGIYSEDRGSRVTLTEKDNGGIVVVSSQDKTSLVGLLIGDSGGIVTATGVSGGSAMLYANNGSGIVDVRKEGAPPTRP